MSANQNASSAVYGTFLDLANDVKPWLRVPSADTARDVQLQLIADMACTWVQNFLGRPVAPTTFDRRFDGWSGWNGAYLMLPRTPVLEVVSVVEYRGVMGAFTLPESTPASQVDGWQLVPQTGRLNRVFPGNVAKPWFPGERNIEVVWVAGMNPVPADIKVATLEMVAHWFHNTQQQSGVRAAGLTAADEYDPAGSAGMFSGVPFRVTDLLEPYVQVGIG